MYAWEQIQKVVDYIEEHLNEEVSIDLLANQAALSPFYFQRLFSRLVKKSAAEYVKLRRMTKAAEELLEDEEKRILDVALDYGFTSHEHFTRAFKAAFGLTPTEFRKEKPAINRMTKPNLMLHYTLVDEGVPLISDGIVLEINRKKLDSPICFIGIEQDVSLQVMEELGAGTGVDPLDATWNELHATKQSKLGIENNAEELGVAYESKQPGCFCYFAGTIKNHAEEADMKLPDGYKAWILPEGEYIVCSIEADCFASLVMDTLYKAQQYIYNTWLPNHKLGTEPFAAERYPSHSPETTYMEVWLKIAK